MVMIRVPVCIPYILIDIIATQPKNHIMRLPINNIIQVFLLEGRQVVVGDSGTPMPKKPDGVKLPAPAGIPPSAEFICVGVTNYGELTMIIVRVVVSYIIVAGMSIYVTNGK